MKKIVILFVAISLCCTCFAQEEKSNNRFYTYSEASFSLAFFNKTKKLDNYFSEKYYGDYYRTRIPNINAGYCYGFVFAKDFAFDLNFNMGIGESFSDLRKARYQQSKTMISLTSALMFEYFFFNLGDKYSFSLKTGYGVDYTSFWYNRKIVNNIVNPTVYSLSWTNSFVPIRLAFYISDDTNSKRESGVYLQYNIRTTKGNAKYRGLDVAVDEALPNVSQNSFMIGYCYRW